MVEVLSETTMSSTFITKLFEVPVVKSAATAVSSVYFRVKGHNVVCQVGFTMTEDALYKVYVVLEPLRKKYNNTSVDAKLCDWLTFVEKEYPQVMIPVEEVVTQSRECCEYYAYRTTATVCQWPVTHRCYDALERFLECYHQFCKFQIQKIMAVKMCVRQLMGIRFNVTLKDFSSPRRIASPKKRVSKWYQWIHGVQSDVTLQNGDLLDQLSGAPSVHSPEEKKRKRDEDKSESDVTLSELLEDLVSEDDTEYKEPAISDMSSTDSLEYRESSDEDIENDEAEGQHFRSPMPDFEEQDNFCSPAPEADRSLNDNSFTHIAPDEPQEQMEEDLD